LHLQRQLLVRDEGDTVASGDAIAFLDSERCDRSPIRARASSSWTGSTVAITAF